jgi:hypothetical protein
MSMSFTGASEASALCTESVINVIVHTNGNIYFMTDKTCSGNWCQLNLAAGNASVNKSAYAMLMTAMTTSKPISFQWDVISDCTQQNAIYTSPAYMVFPR